MDGGAARDALALTGIGHSGGLLSGAVWLAGHLWHQAGGCAVGTDVSGALVFTLTALVTPGTMWARRC